MQPVESVNGSALAELVKQKASPEFKNRFVDVPSHLSSWSKEFGSLAAKRVLDFGCGNGDSACGVALFLGAERVVGVDVIAPAAGLSGRLAAFAELPNIPENVGFERIADCSALPREQFDFIYSWSFLDRLPTAMLSNVAAELYDRLALGGRMLLQLSPLYYSPKGAKLAQYGVDHWLHLSAPLAELKRRVLDGGTDDALRRSAAWANFESLNRIGPRQLLEIFGRDGFHYIRHYETFAKEEPPPEVAESYQRETLMREQVLILFCKA